MNFLKIPVKTRTGEKATIIGLIDDSRAICALKPFGSICVRGLTQLLFDDPKEAVGDSQAIEGQSQDGPRFIGGKSVEDYSPVDGADKFKNVPRKDRAPIEEREHIAPPPKKRGRKAGTKYPKKKAVQPLPAPLIQAVDTLVSPMPTIEVRYEQPATTQIL